MQEPVQKNKNTAALSIRLILFFLVCALGYFVSSQLEEELDKFIPETMSNCSTRNKQASGYKAFFELAQKTDLNCVRFESSYRELEKESGTLVIVAPTSLMMSYDVDKVLKWVAKGNNLVYLDYCIYGSGKKLLERLSLFPILGRSLQNKAISELPKIDVMQHVSQLVVSTETRLLGGESILCDKDDPKQEGHNSVKSSNEPNTADSKLANLLVEVSYGKGKCLIGTVPGLCSNSRISDRSNWGNFQFLINWLKTSPNSKIFFDEKVHGFSNNQNFYVFLLRGAGGSVFLQALLIFGIALVSLNQRFGAVSSIVSIRKISACEYIDGMALTYQRAQAYTAAFSIIYGSFKSKLCKALSVSPEEEPRSIARVWADSTQISYAETLAFLSKAEEIQHSEHMSEEQLISAIRDCDSLHARSQVFLALQAGHRFGG